MPDTPTTRLSLYKSLPDGSENVNYTQDIGQNWDRVDAAVGFQAVTSSTRPSSPYSGKAIMETDTAYRTYFSNGTSPASASWVEIPNGSASYNSNLNMALGRQLNIGGSGSSAAYACNFSSATGDFIISGRVVGDGSSRLTLRADGQLGWGPGSSGTDVFLARSGTSTLTLTGNLTVTGIGARSFVRKTADESLTSNTTLQNDDALVLAVAANATYTFRVWILAVDATDATGDIKFGFTFPTGATCHFSGKGPHTGMAAGGAFGDGEYIGRNTATSGTTVVTYGLSTSIVGVEITGLLIVGGTAGNLQLQWAQNASDANATTVQAGSFMTLERVA